MSSLKLWEKVDEVTVFQAALLSIGIDPSNMDSRHYEDGAAPEGYDQFRQMILVALVNGEISGRISVKLSTEPDQLNSKRYAGVGSVVNVASLKAYYAKKDLTDKFFRPTSLGVCNVFDKSSPYYPPKLDTAMRVWMALKEDSNLLAGKRAKTAAEDYLKANAKKFGLCHEKGELMEDTINMIAKIVNFDQRGGVPQSTAKPVKKLKAA